MEVRHNIQLNENGLYATKSYNKDDLIHELVGEIFDEPTRETIRISDNEHIHDMFGMYMNHSFEPSCYIKENKVMAIKDIYPNDELTFNYNDNEVDMACPFEVDGILVAGKQ